MTKTYEAHGRQWELVISHEGWHIAKSHVDAIFGDYWHLYEGNTGVDLILSPTQLDTLTEALDAVGSAIYE